MHHAECTLGVTGRTRRRSAGGNDAQTIDFRGVVHPDGVMDLVQLAQLVSRRRVCRPLSIEHSPALCMAHRALTMKT